MTYRLPAAKPLITALLAGAWLGGILSSNSALAQSSQNSEGAALYETHCVVCHGADGRGGQGFPRPVWGAGHDLKKFRTAQGLYEYIQLTMPFDNPQKMTDAQKLAVVAFLLERIGTITATTDINAGNMSKLAIK